MAYLRKGGAVTQAELEETTTDIRQDVNVLALREAVTENRVAYTSPNTFIDQYQDSTGIDSLTTARRSGSEYVACQGATTDEVAFDYVGANSGNGITATEVGSWNMSSTLTIGGSANAVPLFYNLAQSHWAFSAGTTDVGFYVDYLQGYEWTDIAIGKNNTWGDITQVHLSHSDDASTWTNFNLTGASQSAVSFPDGGTDSCDLSTFSSAGIIDWGNFTNTSAPNSVINTFGGWSSSVTKRYLRLIFKAIGSTSGGNYNAGYSAFLPYHKVGFLGATGTLLGNANVPSSARTKVSGVLLYKDGSGTATIGTDLKIYFTCDGGSNWTEAVSYTAVTPVFSTGVKMIKLGKTTCISGSDVRYKAVWANQASGSKDTQLHGVGLNY